MANAQEIGAKLVEYCQQGKNSQAITELYADNCVSVEAAEMPNFGREATGKQAIEQKNQWWAENHEVHSAEAHGPFPHGENRFAVRFKMDVTSKVMGNQRMQLEEIGVYEVAGGQVVREEFFYGMS